jgi:hypothetical protein
MAGPMPRMGMKVPASATVDCGDKTIDLCVSLTEYGLPIDEEELDRIDMSHAKYIMLLEKKLFLAPITPNPQRILDLGTGTGKLHMENIPMGLLP